MEKLTPSSNALWGKMKIEQMLAHLYLSFQVNFGMIELKRDFIMSTFFKSIARRILLKEKPFPKHLPADKKVLTKSPGDFYVEKQKVEQMIKSYVEKGPEALSKNPHNVLGKITPEESACISYKHVDHHLRQFGV